MYTSSFVRVSCCILLFFRMSPDADLLKLRHSYRIWTSEGPLCPLDKHMPAFSGGRFLAGDRCRQVGQWACRSKLWLHTSWCQTLGIECFSWTCCYLSDSYTLPVVVSSHGHALKRLIHKSTFMLLWSSASPAILLKVLPTSKVVTTGPVTWPEFNIMYLSRSVSMLKAWTSKRPKGASSRLKEIFWKWQASCVCLEDWHLLYGIPSIVKLLDFYIRQYVEILAFMLHSFSWIGFAWSNKDG